MKTSILLIILIALCIYKCRAAPQARILSELNLIESKVEELDARIKSLKNNLDLDTKDTETSGKKPSCYGSFCRHGGMLTDDTAGSLDTKQTLSEDKQVSQNAVEKELLSDNKLEDLLELLLKMKDGEN